MSSDLRELAARYTALSQELDELRESIKRCVSNGADTTPNPTRLRASRSGSRRKSILAEMKLQDGRVLDTLKSGPMRQVDIARSMDIGQSSVQARLTRLHKQGSVARDESGLWSLAPPT